MAFLDGLAVRFEDLPFPSSSALVTVLDGLEVTTSASTAAVVSISDLVTVINGLEPRLTYEVGYADGELYGFSSVREQVMGPVILDETDDDKKTIAFHIYNTTGLPASGITGEGAVCSPALGELQVNRDLTGYVNAAGVFSHVGDGEYRYTFPNSEVAASGGEGNIWLRVKVSGFRTVVIRTPIRVFPITAVDIRDAILDAARTGHIATGSIGEGVAIATALLQGNFYMDNVTNAFNGQTAARMRCFHTGAAAQAATPGGTGQGEFATFLVTTTYNGPNKVTSHRVVQQ